MAEERKVHADSALIDASLALPTGVCGGVAGFCASYCYPFAVPFVVEKIREGVVDTCTRFGATVGFFAGYGYGLWDITHRIVEQPSNPVSYAPIAANLFFGAVEIGARMGRKSEKRSQLGSSS